MTKHIKYILLFTLLIGFCKLHAQDTLVNKISLTIGVDIVGPIKMAINSDRKMMEMSVTAGSVNNFYTTVEGGYLKISEKNTKYAYKAKGQFVRVGFDYNIFNKNMPWEHNRILVGARYGIASLSHEAGSIVITDKFWGNYATNFSSQNVSAQWLEACLNLRAEMFKNFSMGWAIQIRILTTSKGMVNIKPSYIPGFGQGNSNTALGFTYSIYYSIPLFNKKIK